MVKKVLSLIATFVFGGIGIFCMIYYFGKFYINGSLKLEHNMLFCFAIVVTMIIISLIFGMILYVQNLRLSSQISHLSKELEQFHYSEMSLIKSNMECILDLEEGRD